ncbi:hypothetical protein B0H13DRAFT_2508436 [Mycena leptocephala]|nr:hypothetical protein B0H13DRAFT_2508436 [Mycena leptocephala]
MFQALGLFLILAGQGIFEPHRVDAVSLVPSDAVNFNAQTLAPPASSGGHIVFNWHDNDDSGDHNAVDTRIFMLTDGGNSSLADNSTGQYVIEALAVQFNKTHFSQNASSTPWVAIFPCTGNSSVGNTSDLIANAQRLGAHAILAYTEGSSTYQYCNISSDNTPPATIPIYTTENWHDAFLVFSDEIGALFAPTPLQFYNAKAMNSLTANVTRDFDTLRSNSSFLTQSDAVLARIPAITSNVSAAEAAAASATTTGAPGATKTPSAAVRLRLETAALVVLVVGVFFGW